MGKSKKVFVKILQDRPFHHFRAGSWDRPGCIREIDEQDFRQIDADYPKCFEKVSQEEYVEYHEALGTPPEDYTEEPAENPETEESETKGAESSEALNWRPDKEDGDKMMESPENK